MLPTIAEVGRLIDEPELRFAASGMAVCRLRLAFNSRRKNPQTNEWEDGETLFVDGTAFKQLAENCAESLTRGMEVLVKGRLKTESWEDRESGQKRSKTSLMVESIGPSLAYATAKVQKMSRGSGGGEPGFGAPSGGQDPWATAGPQRGGTGGFSEEPPF